MRASLAAYLAAKHQPKRQRNDVEEIDVADVISIYVDDRRLLDHDAASQIFARLERLNNFWGGKKLSEINGETCREYTRRCGSDGGARRDLEDIRAAVNHHAKEGYHRGIVRVVLPPNGKARERWLTRGVGATSASFAILSWSGMASQSHRQSRQRSTVRRASRPRRWRDTTHFTAYSRDLVDAGRCR